MILKLLILLLRFLNLTYYHFAELLEKFNPSPAWSKELGLYFHTDPQQIIKAYHLKRSQAAKLWTKSKRQKISQIFSFYSETDYWVYRQTYFNRLKIFLDIALGLILKPSGKVCEYGAGVGPVTHWLIKYFKAWRYYLVDLDCPVLTFSRWRFRNYPQVSFGVVKSLTPPLKDNFDIIICKQVLEHVPNPLTIIKSFVKHLKPGGWIFLDYVNDPGQENLIASAKNRRQVLKYLDIKLQPILRINPENPKEGYGLYVKK